MKSLIFLLPLLQLAAAEWELLWSDEFDGDTLDESAWTAREGFLGFNSEFQTYTPDNIEVKDGKLHITAQRDVGAQVGYTSGRLNSLDKVQVKYGTIEASIKIPNMKMGLWPAFWTLGENYPEVGWPKSGELDILEAGQKLGSSLGLGNRRIVTASHWDAYGEYVVEDAYLDMPYDLSAAFHNYKMVWQPDFIDFYVDNNRVDRVRIDYCSTLWDCEEFHQYHFMVLNLAVAGLFTCCEYGFELNDYPNGTAWTMEVDYVRVYGNEHTEVILPEEPEVVPTTNQTATNQTGAPTTTPGTAAPTTAFPTMDVTPVPTTTTVSPTQLPIMTTPKPTPSPGNTSMPTSTEPLPENTSMPTATPAVLTPLPEPTATTTITTTMPSANAITALPTTGSTGEIAAPSGPPTVTTLSPTVNLQASLQTAVPEAVATSQPSSPEPTMQDVKTGVPTAATTMAPTTMSPSEDTDDTDTTSQPSSIQTIDQTEDTLAILEGLLLNDIDNGNAVVTNAPTEEEDMAGNYGFSNDAGIQENEKAPTASPGDDEDGGAAEFFDGPQVEVGLVSASYEQQQRFFWILLLATGLLLV